MKVITFIEDPRRRRSSGMKSKSIYTAAFFMILIAMTCSGNNPDEKVSGLITSFLQQEFDLAGERSPETQYYFMETKIVHFALDGKRTGIDTYKLWLECIPASLSGKEGDEYICRRFTVQKGTESPSSIRALDGWSYIFKGDLDEKGQVFGIDHSRFENLETEDGNPLQPGTAYFVYNTFIDYHAFCNEFAERTDEGNGIQNLKTIGEKIVHASAFSEPPINLGSNVAEGSTFKNGEITLEFKGISLVDGRPCSVVAFDSGESSFNMIMQPTPEMEIKSVGSSHYEGDLFIDLKSNWVRKVIMGETVVAEVTLPMPPHKLNSVIERRTIIQSVSQAEFLQN